MSEEWDDNTTDIIKHLDKIRDANASLRDKMVSQKQLEKLLGLRGFGGRHTPVAS